MNENSDFLYNQILSWLAEESNSDQSPPQDGEPNQIDSAEESIVDGEIEQLNDLDREQDEKPTQSPQKLDMGDITQVKNRFQSLLKRKLLAEIESHPPLFPWETENSSYEPEITDSLINNLVPFQRLWMPQLSNLGLPKKILVQLLDACSAAMQSRRPEGAKMVQAVSGLFPQQFQSLNQMAGIVLVGPSRSAELDLPSRDYETATTQQQMAMSLIAAREIINNLTINLSPHQPSVERQWQTTVGLVALDAEYQPAKEDGSISSRASLRVNVRLPKGGSVTLQTPQESAKAERTYPGHLSVELFDWQPGQIYSLEIRLFDPDQTPLNFVLAISE
ncbi:MAG: hypothetical protein WA865_22640 [Spirulinaceae cyanobacterium]